MTNANFASKFLKIAFYHIILSLDKLQKMCIEKVCMTSGRNVLILVLTFPWLIATLVCVRSSTTPQHVDPQQVTSPSAVRAHLSRATILIYDFAHAVVYNKAK